MTPQPGLRLVITLDPIPQAATGGNNGDTDNGQRRYGGQGGLAVIAVEGAGGSEYNCNGAQVVCSRCFWRFNRSYF